MNSKQLAAVLVAAVMAQPMVALAQTASESPGDSAARVASQVGTTIERGAKAAAHGIERGAKATERGVTIGIEATARGIAKGAQATARAAEALARKLEPGASQSATPSAKS